ncbi:hypothetical protein JXB31_03730 [Candidatus Woesearchaeota archaeon]|nr:hypothetical protein [Candidatus Woesearchaeota archaeon]
MEKDIKEILEVEKQAETILKNANKKAEKIISSGNADSITLRLDFEKRLEDKKEKELRKNEAIIKEKCNDIIKRGAADKEKLEIKAEKNMEQAVSYVITALKSI